MLTSVLCSLAELIAREEQIYESELASLTKTADERKRDMQQRAEALKSNREEKRKAQAEAALLRRWRPCTEFSLALSRVFIVLPS